MSTPKYTALVSKLRDWSNKPESATIADSVLSDCLLYASDFCYYNLKVPQLEKTQTYTITVPDNITSNKNYTKYPIPASLIEFISIRCISPVGNKFRFVEVLDKKNFYEQYQVAENTFTWIWLDQNLYIYPQLPVGSIIEIASFSRLSAIDSSESGGIEEYNWLRDDKQYLLLWVALIYLAAYLLDDQMMARYKALSTEILTSLNSRENEARSLTPVDIKKAISDSNTRKVSV